MEDWEEAYEKVKIALEKILEKKKNATDCHRCFLELTFGGWVPLCVEKARLKKMRGKERLYLRLSIRYYEPFQVIDKINEVYFKLKMPKIQSIHKSFHARLLKPFSGEVPIDMVDEPQSEVEERDEVLVPEHFRQERKGGGKVMHTLVNFQNYLVKDVKWLDEGDLADLPQD